jgi:hypothetical protein
VRILTVADIARQTHERRHVVDHAISVHGPEPTGRVGIIRTWDEELLPQILESIRKSKGRSGRQKQVSK